MKKIIPIFLIIASACARPGHDNGSGEPQALAPVYEYFAEYGSASALPDSLRPEVEAFMKVTGRGDASAPALAAWAASPAVEVFTPAVDSVFPSLAPVEQGLGDVLARAVREGLDLPRRRYAAVVWGRPESIVFCDSVMLVALNHYLGASYPGYSHLPAYARAAKEPSRLVPDMAEALVGTACPYERREGSTVLSRLLYEGAMAEARMRLCGIGEAEALGYDEDTYADLAAHEGELWQLLVARGLLYSTLPADAERLVSPAPSVPLLGAAVPGRAGRFIGLRIVQSYLRKHPEATLPELLSPAFYDSDETLRRAAYTGGI